MVSFAFYIPIALSKRLPFRHLFLEKHLKKEPFKITFNFFLCDVNVQFQDYIECLVYIKREILKRNEG